MPQGPTSPALGGSWAWVASWGSHWVRTTGPWGWPHLLEASLWLLCVSLSCGQEEGCWDFGQDDQPFQAGPIFRTKSGAQIWLQIWDFAFHTQFPHMPVRGLSFFLINCNKPFCFGFYLGPHLAVPRCKPGFNEHQCFSRHLQNPKRNSMSQECGSCKAPGSSPGPSKYLKKKKKWSRSYSTTADLGRTRVRSMAPHMVP